MKGRRWRERPRLELGMVLASNIVRMLAARQLCHFHAGARFVATDEFQARIVNFIHHGRIDFVPVPVALRNFRLAPVHGLRGAVGAIRGVRKFGETGTEAHGATHLVLVNFWHENDHLVLGVLVEFCRIGVLPVEHVATVFDDHGLEAEADAQVWFLVGAAVFGSEGFAKEATGVINRNDGAV